MTQQPLSRALPTRLALGTAGMVVLLATAACGSSSDGSGGSDSKAAAGSQDAPAAALPENRSELGPNGADFSAELSSNRDAIDANVEDVDAGSKTGPAVQTVAVISTGTVSLQSDDVARARFDVRKIVDQYRGTIAEEETTTNDDGEVDTSRMVLRIPSKDFTRVTKKLEGVADLLSSSSGSEDVTTKVIDNEVRIRAQEKSLERVEALLVQATNLREVIAIESQLTRRQADLDSLKSRQAYLADQTTLSTVAVSIERTPEKKKSHHDKEQTGFLRGLSAGWGGFVAAMVGLATVLGFLLPFTLVVALFGVPMWLVLKNVRRRRPEPEPELS
jgi:hypothetical protein